LTFPSVIFDDIKQGRAVLVTGAGISNHGGHNQHRKPIISSGELAALVAKAGGFEYSGEQLKDVFEASAEPAGDAKLKRIFEDNFMNTRASDSLEKLFNVCWRRVYTFNIDDTIENISKARRQQIFRSFNANSSRVEEWNGYHECQVVHLHGRASEFEHGFTFSHTEYASDAASLPPWYSRLGGDFVDYTILFVGTSLDEQTLFQSVQSAVTGGSRPGTSYSITPDKLTPIKIESLKRRGILHIEAGIDEFATSLSSAFPGGIGVGDVDSGTAAATAAKDHQLTKSDLDALMSLRPIEKKSAVDKKLSAPSVRRFYQGYGPTQAVIKSGSYAKLQQYAQLERNIMPLIDNERCVVVLGQSGSGKSTFAMHMAMHISSTKETVFEYSRGSSGLKNTLIALRRFANGKRCYVLLDDLNVYSDDLSEILADADFSNIFILTSARSGEWNDRLSGDLAARSKTVHLDRFSRGDIPALITAIRENYAAPAFVKLSPERQRSRFEKSDRQLLIAMLEATEEKGFEQIIRDEFESIADEDQRLLLLAIAYATMSRVGIDRAALSTIARRLGISRNLSDVTSGLTGIVGENNSGRYAARHEVYAREIVMRHGDFDEIERSLEALTRYFTDYSMPIIKHVSKIDGQLFKYVLNNKNIYDLYKTAGMQKKAPSFFGRFEIDLQLDGHFWLQYGLLLRRCGEHTQSLAMLEKSIQAYPENTYAQHALAQQKLILAAQNRQATATASRLMDEAVDVLLRRHYSLSDERVDGAPDEYPIVALGYYHVDALVAVGRPDDARAAAKKYFAEIQKIKHGQSDHILRELSKKLIMLNTTGTWERLHYRVGNIAYL